MSGCLRAAAGMAQGGYVAMSTKCTIFWTYHAGPEPAWKRTRSKFPCLMDTTTFVGRLQASFDQLYQYVPALFGVLVILFAGYLLSRACWGKATEKLLRRMHFNRILERGGVLKAVERSGSHMNPTRVASNVMFWFVMFAVIMVAAQALRLQSLTDVFSELVSYVPSIIAAIVIIIIGIVLGDFVSGSHHGVGGWDASSVIEAGGAIAGWERGGVVVLAVFMALQELGVATEIVTTAFAILFGAIALAAALAFGLGNRDLAGEVTRTWYESYRAEREAIERGIAAL